LLEFNKFTLSIKKQISHEYLGPTGIPMVSQ
jgi:hypothetical protein